MFLTLLILTSIELWKNKNFAQKRTLITKISVCNRVLHVKPSNVAQKAMVVIRLSLRGKLIKKLLLGYRK